MSACINFASIPKGRTHGVIDESLVCIGSVEVWMELHLSQVCLNCVSSITSCMSSVKTSGTFYNNHENTIINYEQQLTSSFSNVIVIKAFSYITLVLDSSLPGELPGRWATPS